MEYIFHINHKVWQKQLAMLLFRKKRELCILSRQEKSPIFHRFTATGDTDRSYLRFVDVYDLLCDLYIYLLYCINQQ